MPFVSQAQAKWAFATKQPWARKWGHKTRLAGGIARLPQYVARKGRKWGKRRLVTQKEVPSATPAIGNASGPGGLFSSPSMERLAHRRKRQDRVRRYRSQITTKEGSGNTGAMVAFYIPMDAAMCMAQAGNDLFCERGEAACDLHITLAYLGKVADLEGRLPMLVPIVQRYVQMWLETVGAPIEATLRGYDAFGHAIQEDGSVPIYRVVDSPLLMLWQDGLARVLDFAGITKHREHGAYTPHVTIAYTYPELVELLPQTPATAHTVQFDHVTLVLGDLHIDMPLAVPTYKALPIITKAATQISPGVYKIRGNLCQVHGKFGPCNAATSEGFNAKPKKGKGGKGAKPKLTDEQKAAKRQQDANVRKQEAAAQKVQNRTETLGKLSRRPNDAAMGVLDTLRQGGEADPAMAKSMESTGLLTKHADGSYTLSPHGHSLLNALDHGDPAAAVEALAKGGDQVAAAADRAKTQAERAQARQARIAERAAAKTARERERERKRRAQAQRPHKGA